MENRVEAALILKDCEQTIAACIDSLTPFCSKVVACIDSSSSDGTEEIARAHGARIHRFTWRDNFAAARNEAFSYLDPTADFFYWQDGDDVFVGDPALLDSMLTGLKPLTNYVGVYLPYEYGHDEHGRVTTVFTRERFLRPSAKWTWKGRVHETVFSAEPAVPPGQWAHAENFKVVHGKHDMAGSVARNTRLLLKQFEDDDPSTYDRDRCLRELGDTYFASADWNEAIRWYLRCADETDSDIDRWWSWLHIADAARQIHDLDQAQDAALQAFALYPNWAESNLCLANVAIARGEWAKSAAHALRVPTCEETPHIVFRCPLDRTLNWRAIAAESYGNIGRVEEAVKLLAPVKDLDPRVPDALKTYRTALRQKKAAEAYIRENVDRIDPVTPTPTIATLGAVRDLYVPRLLHRRGRPDVTFFCGGSLEDWSPRKLDEEGIGGSETAVVQVSRRLNAAGLRVEVYGQPGRDEGEHDGVGYWDARRYNPARVGESFISWRNPAVLPLAGDAPSRILWLHDLNSGTGIGPDVRGYTSVLGVSAWHADYLRRQYPFLENVGFIPNGVDLARFAGEEDRAVHRCAWSSSPDRGLDSLLVMWPRIKKGVPDAELHIFYGWDGVDRAIRGGRLDLLPFRQHVTRMAEELKPLGVTWRGRLGQKELARELMKCDVLTYPSHFLETNFIGGIEAMAAGTAVVSTAMGAIPEQVGDYTDKSDPIGAGLLLRSRFPNSPAYQSTFVGCAIRVLVDQAERRAMTARGWERARSRTWDAAAEKWLALLASPAQKEAVA